jgi:hypothetical protein
MEGRWYAEELGSAACAVSDLYDLRFVLELMREVRINEIGKSSMMS